MDEKIDQKSDSGSTLESSMTAKYLQLVGSRVRRYRLEISMSRKLLARQSGVSERYLAQLESGQGNMSIALLRKVACAINIELAVLMSESDIEELPELVI